MAPARTTPSAAPDLLKEIERVLTARADGPTARLRALARRWERTLRKLRPLGGASRGNRLEAFPSGDPVFEAMWEAIETAERRVVLETYELDDDRVGRRTLEALVHAARRGCEVVVVADAFAADPNLALVDELREAGGAYVPFNPPLRLSARFVRLVRDHKKIVVVDGRVAFCGGLNFTECYAGERFGTGRFRDTQLRLLGPCVVDLEQLVLATAAESDGPSLPPSARPPEVEDGSLVQVLESNVRRKVRAIQRALHRTVGRSSQRVLVTSPYFVPPGRLIRGLTRAAQRGVDVRVLTAGRSDVPMVHRASQHLYGRLLKAGVRIFEMTERTLHAKTVVIDGVYATVGSFNLDHWSYRRNLEVNVSTLDPHMARELEGHFASDLSLSEEVTLDRWHGRTWLQRVAHWIAYQLVRL